MEEILSSSTNLDREQEVSHPSKISVKKNSKYNESGLEANLFLD